MRKIFVVQALLLAGFMARGSAMQDDTLPALTEDNVPKTMEALWADFDPRKEPLDAEVLKEWEEDGVVLRVVRFRVGIFRGYRVMAAGIYAFPRGGQDLPGLLQIHGGGQYADHKAPLTNAKRGYATLSLSWGGRISAPEYHVNPAVTRLFWEGETNNPHYRIITDWGPLDAYHAPNRNDRNTNWGDLRPAEWTLDPFNSPRNSNWFLNALLCRRGLTFLERQPEVDGDRLGVYGHSMGGKLTVMVAGTDARVKAAAPSCGGISDRADRDPLITATLCDHNYLPRITCPVMFLKPANDFHGRINDLPASVEEIRTDAWRITSAAHHSHQDNAECEVATQVWMDQHLKGTFQVPQTPTLRLDLNTGDGVPVVTVKADDSLPVLRVDVFYTQHGQMDGGPDDRENTMSRFWHYAATENQGGSWTARLPLSSVDKPLWVYANVVYPLDPPITGAGYYYRIYTADRFNLSSLMSMTTAADLKAAGIQPAMKSSRLIESFQGEWEKEWYTYRPEEWGRYTHKLYSEVWAAPEGAKLAFDVFCREPNKMVVGLDKTGAEITLSGGEAWQPVLLEAEHFRSASGEARTDWKDLRELRLLAKDRLTAKVDGQEKVLELGGGWKGEPPRFRNLRWLTSD